LLKGSKRKVLSLFLYGTKRSIFKLPKIFNLIMRKFYLLLFFVAIVFQNANAQKYLSPIFNYDSILNVKFGSNVTANSSTPEDQLYDIYLPIGDSATKRPVVFFTHGGSFLSGSKETSDVVALCRAFAKRGYVTVSQNYRLGYESFDAINAKRAVWRAMQDGRAAVRHVRAHAAQYLIDTNMIIYGGSSAGGFTALHVAFLDEPQELVSGIDTAAYTGPGSQGLGSFKGTTNNLSNSDEVNAVINLCGAIGDTSWIQLKDKNIPVLCMHGTADNTVPYGTAVIKLFNTIPLLNVSGSSSIRKALNDKQIVNRFYTFCGLDHVPFLGTTAVQKSWMDTTVLFISQFLYYDVLKLSAVNPNANIQEIDSADCATTGIYATPIAAAKISPNPTQHSVLVELKNSNAMLQQIAIMDLTGRVVGLHNIDNENQTSVDLQNFDKGIYLLKIITSEGMIIERIIKE
jgi:alpha/beta superfamily hydrolase